MLLSVSILCSIVLNQDTDTRTCRSVLFVMSVIARGLELGIVRSKFNSSRKFCHPSSIVLELELPSGVCTVLCVTFSGPNRHVKNEHRWSGIHSIA